MLLEFIAGEGGIALLDMNPGLIIWTFIAFFVVLFILSKFAWGPIAKAVDDRAAKVHDDIDRAEKLKTDAESKLEEYVKKLDGLKEEGHAIVSEANEDAKKLKDTMLEEAKQEADAIKGRAMREVELAKDQALESIHKTVATVATAVAAKLIEKNLSNEDHSKLVSETLKEVGSLN